MSSFLPGFTLSILACLRRRSHFIPTICAAYTNVPMISSVTASRDAPEFAFETDYGHDFFFFL